jgi:histidinol-phosphate phosphatase family protein
MKSRAVFLDRDGVINRYPGDKLYVTRLSRFKFLPQAKRGVALLTKAGFKVFVISNQAGVGRGVYSRKELDKITVYMSKEVEDAGGKLNAVHYCIHRPEENCSCRKPKVGMIKLAISKHKEIDLKKSFFVGDTIRDVLTAKGAKLRSILVFSGKEKLKNRRNWEADPDYLCKNLYQAARLILREI